MCSERSTGRISPTSVASGYAFGSRRGLEALWKRRTAETRSRRQRGRRRKWSVCSEFTRRRHRPQQPAPPRPLPDAAGRLGLLAERDGRRLERRLGQLQRLSAVVDRPRRLRGGDGRDLDRLRQRLGDPGPGRLPRRRHAPGWQQHVVRERVRRLGGRRSAGGSAANANDWIVIDAGGFPVGASITTPHSLLMGYGFEGITSQAQRNVVMERILDHLLG